MVVVDRDLEADALDPLLAQLVADPAQDIAADSASVEKTAPNKTSRGIDGEPIDPADIVLFSRARLTVATVDFRRRPHQCRKPSALRPATRPSPEVTQP